MGLVFRANSRRLEDLGGGTGHNFCRFVGEGILESISSVLMVGSLILEQIQYWEILGKKNGLILHLLFARRQKDDDRSAFLG